MYTSATHLLQVVHICVVCIYMFICMHMYVDTYVHLWYCLTRWGIEIFCLRIDIRVHVCVYVCACTRVYVHVHMYVYVCLCICMCIHVYAHACGFYIYTRVGAFCLFVLSNPSTTCVCITGVVSHLHACVVRDWKLFIFSSLFMVSACCWCGRLCYGRGRNRSFVSYISLFVGIRVVGECVLVYACTHAQTTWVLDVSPGVGRTPGEPEESRLTKAQYTCRPYKCTKYICLYICWAVGFDDLG